MALKFIGVLAAGCLLASPALARDAVGDFAKILDDHWAWWLSANPQRASELGVRTYDGQLGDPSLAAMDAEAKAAAGFLARLDAIDAGKLSHADRVNHAILRRDLANKVELNSFTQRAVLFSNRRGWHLSFASLPQRAPFFTKADYESYLARLEAYPAFNAAAIETTRSAIAAGATHPCAAMVGFERSISTQIVDDPKASDFYAPFRTRPAAVPESQWPALQARAQAAIGGQVIPAYKTMLAFYSAEYAPKCRKADGAGAMPGGAAWYAYRARFMTTTTMTPDEIHRLGLSEVARIKADMDAAVKASGFQGDRAAYIRYLRTDPKLYPKTPEELMSVASVLAKRIDGEMPKLFGRLPRLPYTIKEVPAAIAAGTTTAYYQQGSPEAGRAGAYFVNTTKLDQRPLFEMPALTVHEAVPGHHQQIALSQELELPLFRKHAVDFTVFTEGWGLYSERLGLDMGLYDTPEKDFGRLSYEMWRAARLVVDTGLHSKGWTRQQAIDFMLEATALSQANIEAEVNRYMVDQGQALAYKLGELKFRELRTRAERELGAAFDLRAFHDAVLANGEVPLDVLDAEVGAWIAARKAAPAS
ncbi:DUF885 domain-containing protein [Phenylobacterium sp.]|uniref:DUF885 domain-containing protein n=1 Tax=Phenylobacterium sp. TaxID=1871053 RepID=UPI002869F2AD|nr:DUF885 domain-containing protein [Phenylobacterium sp.]